MHVFILDIFTQHSWCFLWFTAAAQVHHPEQPVAKSYTYKNKIFTFWPHDQELVCDWANPKGLEWAGDVKGLHHWQVCRVQNKHSRIVRLGWSGVSCHAGVEVRSGSCLLVMVCWWSWWFTSVRQGRSLLVWSYQDSRRDRTSRSSAASSKQWYGDSEASPAGLNTTLVNITDDAGSLLIFPQSLAARSSFYSVSCC